MKNKLALTITILILGVFIAFEVKAQDRLPLVVAPARQTIVIDAGKTENMQIKFFNESIVPVSGNIKVVNFIVNNDDGSPTLLENEENTWVKLPYEKATIASGDVLKVNFKVTVPKDTLPGGRYVAIIFEQVGQLPEATTINEQLSTVSPRIVGLVSIRINGPVTESAFISNFKVPVFLQFGPVPVTFEILNKGGYHITPKGQLVLRNWFGKNVGETILETKNIFPDAKRLYKTELGKNWMFGKYSIDLTANYGEAGKVLLENTSLWVIPVWPIMAIVLFIAIITLLIVLVYKKLKSKQVKLEEKLEEEITEVEELKDKFKDNLPKK
ncbi:hypothetical protein A2422_00075 [Candidatus Woesebacteria bacterium RIFOXYC1_FULL_31_51]|uniref:DUF916 domain-containing protein n=1 Tax=Candidatus Woesebacteria bacterium GW2011_GWC2_31_9 TaxID=1618586 RepID=A0A0F9YIN4_9BACT|nr:MAG: hypothetical protein UR17_C0001G0472 [Candidatus Woesebacteria bacterium GW2011_GWF1_31_35]KKP23058.1 MAG: hypothetical protein UR11_C0001G0032 [Candidatus Woesebacteria bacterium GW2011_GWC1_30_29]KKP25348.1 MAG: hypothetical protein UR13_C0009G0032 [Candidatus Woesebacteria bacterium GW2011_GWD1_31_12]KKP27300.1 MAG: hypothetical protein UR16_C0004G0032 [Candidatus Woesebacteria bacterium GW2011_GWB1_31_29]KKP31213.1 MAG: hypothetical protein UR21_C0013G0007 [Candidatus Woesebacteria 